MLGFRSSIPAACAVAAIYYFLVKSPRAAGETLRIGGTGAANEMIKQRRCAVHG